MSIRAAPPGFSSAVNALPPSLSIQAAMMTN
jgi:hypothetical protein